MGKVRRGRGWSLKTLFQLFSSLLLLLLLLVAILFSHLNSPPHQSANRVNRLGADSTGTTPPRKPDSFRLIRLKDAPLVRLNSSSAHKQTIASAESELSEEERGGWRKCSLYSCLDIGRCGRDGRGQLSVYIYPITRFLVDGEELQGQLSREFYQLLKAIRASGLLVTDPQQACLFVPSVDTLNLNLPVSQKQAFVNRLKVVLNSLPFWGKHGRNHVLFGMHESHSSLVSLKTEAILSLAGFSAASYRLGFHLPLITFNPLLHNYKSNRSTSSEYFSNKNILGISAESSLLQREVVESSPEILFVDFCKRKQNSPADYFRRCKGPRVFNYPEVLKNSAFCVVGGGFGFERALWDAMSVGCIPVIVAQSQRLPFDDIIHWKKNAIILQESEVGGLGSILKSVSVGKIAELRRQIRFTFHSYLADIPTITNTLLQLLQQRIFSHKANSAFHWNLRPSQRRQFGGPLLNVMSVGRESGFTAVVLAYDRVASLFQLIQSLDNVHSLAKVIVVWNNQQKAPPPRSSWPLISRPVKVIQMGENRMSNRFLPLDEIETEAVLSLDDDIVMLTPDEIQFAFQAWLENPERLVGFPSRTHFWDNSTHSWKYESEWKNEVSMVLTGAAFYHKYWHHAFTHELSPAIRSHVDSIMNCEDIAMNFLIAAQTCQPPLKVTPRKKFKCPSCRANEMLSSDSSHMLQRSKCIDLFVSELGFMPLLPAEHRADPVLFKVDNLKHSLLNFPQVGTI